MYLMKINSYNRGQILVRIIVVLVIVGLFGGAFYMYLRKQILVTPKITEPESISSNPLETDRNPNWRNLNWLIVFTNAGETLPSLIKNDLCSGSSTNKLSYLPTWFKREASKYDVSLSVSLSCHNSQIKLPQNVLTNPDHYTAFGQSIPLPLNIAKTSTYILQTIPSSQNYDLITVVDYVTSGGRIADMSSIGGKVSFVFIVKSNFIDGVQYYAPNVTEPNIEADSAFVRSVVHEALHNLGAYDHYDYSNPGDCQTETDQSLRYKSLRVMCASSLNNFADYIIPPETAKEIGWTK